MWRLFLFSVFLALNGHAQVLQGHYFNEQGQYLGTIGKNPQAYMVSDAAHAQIQTGKRAPAIALGTLDNLLCLAAVAYAETFPQSPFVELAAIVWAVVNNNRVQHTGGRGMPETLWQTAYRIAQVTKNGNPRFAAFYQSAPLPADADATLAMRAAVRVLAGLEPDWSGRATLWEGSNALYQQSRWLKDKFTYGIELKPAHTLGLPIKARQWLEFGPDGWWTFYRYQSTAAHGRTVFLRVHPDFVRTFHAPAY